MTAAPVDLLARLVAFDTTSALSNRDLVDFVAAYLRDHRIEARVVPDPSNAKASLIASVGPAVEGGIVLSGHTDVVPVAGQAWTSDPFQLTAKRDRLVGRGTADMKGFLACALAIVPELAARDLRVPIHLAFSYDEEVGCLAAPELVARLREWLPAPALVVVGEPSGMRVADRHRGIHTFETSVRGRTGHASDPAAGVNAIAAAAEIVRALGALADGETTVNVGRIEGGTAVNIVAEHCRIVWETRPGPGTRAADLRARLDAFVEVELLPRMRAVAPEAEVETVERVAVPPFEAIAGSPAVSLLLALTGRNETVSVPFASEAGIFQAGGIPAVVCGPGHPAQAHQPDEYVEIAQLDACMDLLRRLADWAARG